MADYLNQIKQLIAEDSGVSSLVSTRVYRIVLPDNYDGTTLSLVIQDDPENEMSSAGPVDTVNLLCRVIGGTASQQKSVHAAIRTLMSDSYGNGRNNLENAAGDKFLFLACDTQARPMLDDNNNWDYHQFGITAKIVNG